MFRWWLPKTTNFFDYFEKHASIIVQGTKAFIDLVHSGNNFGSHAAHIKQLEIEADHVTHQCIEALHKTFITPFDRYYIYQLSYKLDDIIDFVNQTAAYLVTYKLTNMTKEIQELADILHRSALEVEQVVKGLRNPKNIDELRKKFAAIKHLENESDTLSQQAIAHLFETDTDVLNIIKWKEIYLYLEEAVNHCEYVSNIVEGVILELS